MGEQIGNVATGLSEETISMSMKTRTYISPTTPMNLEEAPCEDQETDFCIICQVLLLFWLYVFLWVEKFEYMHQGQMGLDMSMVYSILNVLI